MGSIGASVGLCTAQSVGGFRLGSMRFGPLLQRAVDYADGAPPHRSILNAQC